MPAKRPSLRDRANEFTQSDVAAHRPPPLIHGNELLRQEIIELPLSEIMPNTQQPRAYFDEAALDELAASIREHGVIQPIIVKAIPLTNWHDSVRRYELIAGERRWRASERAGRATVPCILRDDQAPAALLEVALIENLQRADLTPLEEAAAFGAMQRELKYSYDQIGQRVGKSKGYVMNRMRLLRLDDDLRDLVAERPDTLSHIIHLEKLDFADRPPLIAAVRTDNLSLAEVRRLVEQRLNHVPDQPKELPGADRTAPELFLRKNAEVVEHSDLEPVSFLRKNAPLHEPSASPPDSFLRKNAPSSTRAVGQVTHHIQQIRHIVGAWKNIQLLAEDHHAINAALDELVQDIEDVKQHLQRESGA